MPNFSREIDLLLERFEQLTSSDWSKHIGKCSCKDCVILSDATDDIQRITYFETENHELHQDIEKLYDTIDDLKNQLEKVTKEKELIEDVCNSQEFMIEKITKQLELTK